MLFFSHDLLELTKDPLELIVRLIPAPGSPSYGLIMSTLATRIVSPFRSPVRFTV